VQTFSSMYVILRLHSPYFAWKKIVGMVFPVGSQTRFSCNKNLVHCKWNFYWWYWRHYVLSISLFISPSMQWWLVHILYFNTPHKQKLHWFRSSEREGNESNVIKNDITIAKIVRICMTYQLEFMVFEKELNPVIPVTRITNHAPNLLSCNDALYRA
jgi:hypothetical protein